MDSGQRALEHYKEIVAPEAEFCKTLSRILEETIGLNPFTRC